MAEIKDLSRIGAKWKRVASGAAVEYEEGVKNPKRDWAKATAAAEPAYTQGITAALSRKAFGKGVNKAGTAKWQENAIKKGPGRYSEGVNLAEDAYITGFGPYREIIARTTLPARGARGDPKNINRVAVLAKALHDHKISAGG
jgi:hypothetical protein